MRLFEAILEANHRALSGDARAGVNPSEFPDALPVVALTCIDPRLNRLLPEALGVHEDDFIWLRNAGNIIYEPMSSMMRTLALACAIKGGKEIAIIGHTDCRVRQMSVNQLLDTFRALGVNRASLPDNLIEFFGLFASERQNVINGVEHIRSSPLISPRFPVHGLMIDIESGRLEWLVNGYDHVGRAQATSPLFQKLEQAREFVAEVANFNLGELKFPEVKIGDLVLDPEKWRTEVRVVEDKIKNIKSELKPPRTTAGPAKPAPPPIPIPPPIATKKDQSKSKSR